MGKPTGFLEYGRKDGSIRPEAERINDFKEFHGNLSEEERRKQAARCMDCGVPFCQAGLSISGMISGCPLNNLVPEMNDLVYRGNLAEAYRRLSITHCLPEFTSRVCPALCEAACTCGLHTAPVSTKENEKTVIEYAFENGLVEESAPKVRTDKKVAVIGSGPSGLAAALLLNRRGHEVTVFERSDRVGGLLRYGIPNMKLDKSVIDRRVSMMEKAGINFKTGINIGRDVPAEEIKKSFDAVILACGASNPRNINVEGRDAEGIYFAVDFLGKVTARLQNSDFKEFPFDMAEGKDVIVIGGGDTGNDCVGTCIRLKAKSVVQLEMMPEPPKERTAGNPWPEWPKVLKTDYGQEEAIYKFGSDPRVYKTTVKEFIKDKNGKLKGAVIVSLEPKKDEKTGRMNMVPVAGSEREIPAQLVLIAAGFLGSEAYVTEAFGVETDQRTNVKTAQGKHSSSIKGVFTAGDMHLGQSLVVRAIAEGKRILSTDFARSKTDYWYGYDTESAGVDDAGEKILNPNQAGGTGIYLGKIHELRPATDEEKASYIQAVKKPVSFGAESEGEDLVDPEIQMAVIKGGDYDPDPGDSIRLHKKDDTGRASHKVRVVTKEENGKRWVDIPTGFTRLDEIYLLQTKSMSKRYKRVLPQDLSRFRGQPAGEQLPILDLTPLKKNELSWFPEGLYVGVSTVADAHVVQALHPVRVILELNSETEYDLLNKSGGEKPILPYSKKMVIINLDPFLAEGRFAAMEQTVNKLVELGYENFMVNNLAHINMLRGKDVHMVAGPYLYTFNRWAVSFLENEGIMAYQMPYENSEKNLLDTFTSGEEKSRVLLPVFAYPTLFRMRFKLPKDYDFTYFADKEGMVFKVNSTPDGSFVMPEAPFSIVDKMNSVASKGWKRLLLDFSKTKVQRGDMKDMLSLMQGKASIEGATRFNWKDGFYNPEKMEAYKAMNEKMAQENQSRGGKKSYGKKKSGAKKSGYRKK